MNDTINQLLNPVRSLPPAKKLSIAFTVILVIAGFAAMFMWTNQVDYQILFSNLSQEDAGTIVTKLKERNIPYKIEGNGSFILVPAAQVHDLRLSFAGDGLPKEGNVGFEIFDKTDFGATRFVQELNYQRALQGELARTIGRFREVDSAKVFIVLPKDSLFVEEQKPATASIQLDLRSSLPPSKLAAIVHLTASAVEGLEPESVTVVDTKGRVVFQGGSKDDTSALLSNIQLDYKAKLEAGISQKIQSMLEGIVGPGKAIVRVIAEVDFSNVTRSEEEFDPSSTVVRSSRQSEESSGVGDDSQPAPTVANQRSGVLPDGSSSKSAKKKTDVSTNYEINKITRSIFQPAGNIRRLSVAAVIDGTYRIDTLADGTTERTYVPRSEAELAQFDDIVKSAMGYSEDREDQVSVTTFAFTETLGANGMDTIQGSGGGMLALLSSYRSTFLNLLLVVLVFFIVVRPLLRGLRDVTGGTSGGNREQIGDGTGDYPQLADQQQMSRTDRVREISVSNPEKTEQLIRGWISE